MSKKKTLILLLIVGLMILITVSVSIYKYDKENKKKEIKEPEIKEEFDETKTYYKELEYGYYLDIINWNTASIIAIDKNTNFLYKNVQELLNRLAYKYEINIYYFDISNVQWEDENEYLKNTFEDEIYPVPFIAIYQNGEIIKLTNTDYEEIVKYYKKGIE